MNFPAIAKKTYDRLRSIEEFAFITDLIISELKEIKFAISRARFFHERVDELTRDVFLHPIVNADHGNFDHICSTALNGSIDGISFSKTTHGHIAWINISKESSSP